MLYLLVDPQVFIFSAASQASAIQHFFALLIAWEDAAKEFEIEFGLSEECLIALQSTPQSILNPDYRHMLAEQSNYENPDEMLKALLPLLNRLRYENRFDKLISRLSAEDPYLLSAENVFLAPREHLDRLNDMTRDSFRHMLGSAVFARYQRVLPLSEFHHTALMTVYTDDEFRQWAYGLDNRMILHIRFLRSTNPEHEKVNDDFEAITTPTEQIFSQKTQARQVLQSITQAAKTACARYANVLILTDEAEKTTRQTPYNDYKKIYRLLCGLVEVWLTTYTDAGDWKAHSAYYEKYAYAISGEKEQVQQNDSLRREREGTYKGKLIFGTWHVKVGTGPKAMRIYFAPVKDEGETKIVLTRVGPHPRTALYK